VKIQILCDNPNSWMVPYAALLQKELLEKHDAALIHNAEEVTKGEVLVLLSCEKIFKKLYLNKFNLVVHESDLPSGKGWSPLTWQVIEGKNRIPISLLEAAEAIDSGVIYGKVFIDLDGTELIDELRSKQAMATRQLLLNFLDAYPDVKSMEQQGASSFYPKRKAEDSKLDINRSIGEQFNLLRVVDNERYPAYFEYAGKKYIIKIEKHSDKKH
jgi:methionyl-tRNA formyltransferase